MPSESASDRMGMLGHGREYRLGNSAFLDYWHELQRKGGDHEPLRFHGLPVILDDALADDDVRVV